VVYCFNPISETSFTISARSAAGRLSRPSIDFWMLPPHEKDDTPWLNGHFDTWSKRALKAGPRVRARAFVLGSTERPKLRRERERRSHPRIRLKRLRVPAGKAGRDMILSDQKEPHLPGQEKRSKHHKSLVCFKLLILERGLMSPVYPVLCPKYQHSKGTSFVMRFWPPRLKSCFQDCSARSTVQNRACSGLFSDWLSCFARTTKSSSRSCPA
jgi:hypothetical protein